MRGLIVFLLWALRLSESVATQRIVLHIVADDVGFNDLGFVNDAIQTPTIDALRSKGIALSHLYTSKDCAPSRGSIMTGRYPFRFGYYRNPSDEGGVMLNYTMLPAVLNANGFRTHAVGKWHLGFKSDEYTPTFRGFDTFFGYYHWGEEYSDHVFPPYYKGDQPCRGYDLNNNSGSTINAVGGDLYSTVEHYSTELYANEARRIIRQHPAGESMYMYLAFQNVHDPYETAPPKYTALYPEQVDENRRNFSALVTLLDDGIKNVTQELKDAELWQNTLVIFQTDNGGELPLDDPTPELSGGAGNNYPLRGGKFTLWEGGVRTHAFVYSPNTDLIPASLRGSAYHHMTHVSDWYPTVLEAMGLDMPADTGPYALDGVSFYSAMVGGAETVAAPRTELLHQPFNDYWNASCWDIDLANPYSPACGAAFASWPFKLYWGYPGDNRTVTLGSGREQSRSQSAMTVSSKDAGVASAAIAPSSPVNAYTGDSPFGPNDEGKICASEYGCLYNIRDDPEETVDLVAGGDETYTAIATTMLARLKELSMEAPAPICGDCTDNDAPSDEECAVVDSTGSWQPWEN